MKNLSVKSVRIVGVLPSFPFQRAKMFVLALHRSMPSKFPPPEIEGLLELEWFERLTEWRRIYGADFWRLERPVAVFLDNKFIGTDIDLLKLTNVGNIFVEFVPRKNSSVMKNNFKMDYLARLRATKRIHCYFDICVDDAFIGTLVFQLYSDILPNTCENFTNLCLGKKGSFLSYKGSKIQRIVKGGWLQGGLIGYGTDVKYIKRHNPLEDECYGISHDRRGILSIVNNRNNYTSEFVITFGPNKWMDNQYVAFGQVIEGVKVLIELEKVKTFKDRPLKRIEVKNCGKLNLEEEDESGIPCHLNVKDVKLKKKPRIESIADQVARLIMEAVTQSLAMKEHVPDVIHAGDAPSMMNLDMYFRGFYSLPVEVLEDSAMYIRAHRREFLRNFQPVATEIVEVITYDILAAVLTKFDFTVDLDDVRQTLTHPIYKKLVDGIDMRVEMVEKPYVKKFVDQLTTTAEIMLKTVMTKLAWMRRSSVKVQNFEKQMNEWLLSFTLQESFADDNFKIAERGEAHKTTFVKSPNGMGDCTQKKEGTKDSFAEKKKQKKKEPTAAEICCDIHRGSFSSEDDPTLNDFFSTCIYDLKTVKGERKGRTSILDLIENGRYQLKLIRHHESRTRTKARICIEKQINRWMKVVEYTSETDWIRQTVFAKDDICFSHTEEIMYGAMTIGLLEIYFLMESYLKNPRRKKYISRIVYSESSTSSSFSKNGKDTSAINSRKEPPSLEQDTSLNIWTSTEQSQDGESEDWKDVEPVKKEMESLNEEVEPANEEVEPVSEDVEPVNEEMQKSGKPRKPCTCGDIYCDCSSEPGEEEEGAPVSSMSPLHPSEKSLDIGEQNEEKEDEFGEDEDEEEEEGKEEEEKEKEEKGEGEEEKEEKTEEEGEKEKEEKAEEDEKWEREEAEGEDSTSCTYVSEEVDVDEILTKVMGESGGRVNIKSFKWMQNYIEEEGCEFKSRFARKVHNWLENEIFIYNEFLSKHSLVTRASLLSFSLSIASLIMEENKLKSELKDFIYDLWELYFKEMIKEALLKYPPKEDAADAADTMEVVKDEPESEANMNAVSSKKSPVQKEFDFDKFCEMFTPRPEESATVHVNEKITEDKAQVEETSPNLSGDFAKEPDNLDVKSVHIKEEDIKEEVINVIDVDEYEEEHTIKEEINVVVEGAQKEVMEKIESGKEPRLRVVRELVASSTEIRTAALYTLPFWVHFLAEITKRALGLIAKSGRLPRRLFYKEDQESFEVKLKGWMEFNQFGGPDIANKDIRDFIATHHVEVEDLDTTARSFLRKHRILQLIEKSSRASAASNMANELILDVNAKMLENYAGETYNVPVEILQELFATVGIQESQLSDEEEEESVEMSDTDRGDTESPAEY